MTDYKSYSLSQLENWIHDSITSGEASPHEIYSTIKNAVQEEYNIHKDLSKRCFGLLELLNGHRPVSLNDDWEQHYYPEEVNYTKEDFIKEHEYMEAFVGGLGDDKIVFKTDGEDRTPKVPENLSQTQKKEYLDAKIQVNSPYNDGYTKQYYQDILNKYDGVNTCSPTKWTLPVEVDAASGEYYLQLPDDLLDSLGWKEDDILEYSDNGDGSFSVKKVTKPIKMDEC